MLPRMVGPVVIALLASAPLTNVEERERPELGVHGGIALAHGLVPGASFAFTGGLRVRLWRLSLGLEGLFFLPGEERRSALCPLGRAGNCEERISSVAFTGTVPACVHAGLFSACAIAAGGAAATRSDLWSPMFSAGARLAFDPHVSESVSIYLAAQVLGGIVRARFEGWEAAPLQLGLTVAVLHASS